MHLVTFSPIATNMSLKAGLDPRSDFYHDIVKAVPAEDPQVWVPSLTQSDYANLEQDGYDLRVFVWSAADDSHADEVRFHVYANAIAIAQTRLTLHQEMDADAMEAYAQARTRELITAHLPELNRVLERTRDQIPEIYRDSASGAIVDPQQSISWIARALVLTESEVQDRSTQGLLTPWLENTARPDDAGRIICGDVDFSMTWLNYVVVESNEKRMRMLYSSMRIAQYFYASQEALNEATQATISRTYFTKNVRQAEASLVDARARTQMLRIKYDIQKGYLNRQKRGVIEDIMTVWDFQTLVDNGERMIEVSTSRITEINNRRAERSSFVTDLILTLIALLTVIELSLYMTEYSREVMSRPALEYNDSNLSWILSSVAAIDTDTVLLSGAFSIITLVLIYAYWKIKK
ncbi:MAG: hypothetical protein AB8G16_03665 [Gammaproteobacteria bacterium]